MLPSRTWNQINIVRCMSMSKALWTRLWWTIRHNSGANVHTCDQSESFSVSNQCNKIGNKFHGAHMRFFIKTIFYSYLEQIHIWMSVARRRRKKRLYFSVGTMEFPNEEEKNMLQKIWLHETNDLIMLNEVWTCHIACTRVYSARYGIHYCEIITNWCCDASISVNTMLYSFMNHEMYVPICINDEWKRRENTDWQMNAWNEYVRRMSPRMT